MESIRESDLYLRFVTGQLPARQLMSAQERHIRCNPTTAQFIDDPEFPAVSVDGPFGKEHLDADYVAEQSKLLTRGWQRLQQIADLHDPIPVAEYPLPEFRRSAAE